MVDGVGVELELTLNGVGVELELINIFQLRFNSYTFGDMSQNNEKNRYSLASSFLSMISFSLSSSSSSLFLRSRSLVIEV